MWIITCDVNDYNQHGEYFITCFKKKPSFEEFVKVYLKAEGLRENYYEECDGIERVKSFYNNECYDYGISNTIYHLREIKEGEIKVLE